MELPYSSYSSLPEDPGVYQFLNYKGQVIYVGKAKNLKRRVSSYFAKRSDLGEKTIQLVNQIQRIRVTLVASELESLLLEANLIKKFNPKYNAKLTDGKSYIRIKVTVKDDAPKVLLARKEEDKKAVFFGPYPSSNDVKFVLKFIRRIFPYQSVPNHAKRYCLYYHLGLCPCPPMFKTKEEITAYRKNILHITQFLKGENKKIIKDLEKERDDASKNEQFEEARKIQDKINSVTAITTKSTNPFDYETNPNLLSDVRQKEMTELISALNDNGVNVEKLERIECYDISNISGTNAVGSMVVFSSGEKDGASYRRFKIKNPPKVVPNDFAMMEEVISRRLRHSEWPTPDLMIIDGGKGQVSSAVKALQKANALIPLVGLAKREELLVTTDFKIIRLPRSSNALNLVRRIRDEAHRFAVTYHKKLRAKKFLTSLSK